MPRPPKDPAVLEKIRIAVPDGSYAITFHASQRMLERNITRTELVEALMSGHQEPGKDQYYERMRAWTYAIRGRTTDARELRVAVAIKDAVVVVTVIALNEGNHHED